MVTAPILHPRWSELDLRPGCDVGMPQQEPRHRRCALSETSASSVLLPFSARPIHVISVWQCRTNALRIESRGTRRGKWFGICQAGIQNGEVALRIIIPGRSGGKQKRGPSCQRLNAMKMSEHGPCLPKGLLQTKHLPDRDVCEQRQTFHGERIWLWSVKDNQELPPPTRLLGDRCLWYFDFQYPSHLRSHLAAAPRQFGAASITFINCAKTYKLKCGSESKPCMWWHHHLSLPTIRKQQIIMQIKFKLHNYRKRRFILSAHLSKNY